MLGGEGLGAVSGALSVPASELEKGHPLFLSSGLRVLGRRDVDPAERELTRTRAKPNHRGGSSQMSLTAARQRTSRGPGVLSIVSLKSAAVMGGLALFASGAEAQSIAGVVTDAESGAPLPDVAVVVRGSNVDPVTSMSGADGRFRLTLPEPGRFEITASLLGYRPSDTLSVLVGSAEEVTVLIQLSVRPVEIEGVTVVAKGLELRHRRTYAGFLERRKSAIRVGPARVVTHEDPEMVAAYDVQSVLNWFPPAGCLVIYLDGIHQPMGFGFPGLDQPLSPGQRRNESRARFNRWQISLHDIAGLEFYRWHEDAALEMRDLRYPCQVPPFSVLALWSFPLDSVPGGGN
jgi:hypothetical protein